MILGWAGGSSYFLLVMFADVTGELEEKKDYIFLSSFSPSHMSKAHDRDGPGFVHNTRR